MYDWKNNATLTGKMKLRLREGKAILNALRDMAKVNGGSPVQQARNSLADDLLGTDPRTREIMNRLYSDRHYSLANAMADSFRKAALAEDVQGEFVPLIQYAIDWDAFKANAQINPGHYERSEPGEAEAFLDLLEETGQMAEKGAYSSSDSDTRYPADFGAGLVSDMRETGPTSFFPYAYWLAEHAEAIGSWHQVYITMACLLDHSEDKRDEANDRFVFEEVFQNCWDAYDEEHVRQS